MDKSQNIVVGIFVAIGMISQFLGWFFQGVIDVMLQICDTRQGYPAESFTPLGRGFEAIVRRQQKLSGDK